MDEIQSVQVGLQKDKLDEKFFWDPYAPESFCAETDEHLREYFTDLFVNPCGFDINALEKSDCTTFYIFGKSGSGKSTLKNNLVHYWSNPSNIGLNTELRDYKYLPVEVYLDLASRNPQNIEKIIFDSIIEKLKRLSKSDLVQESEELRNNKKKTKNLYKTLIKFIVNKIREINLASCIYLLFDAKNRALQESISRFSDMSYLKAVEISTNCRNAIMRSLKLMAAVNTGKTLLIRQIFFLPEEITPYVELPDVKISSCYFIKWDIEALSSVIQKRYAICEIMREEGKSNSSVHLDERRIEYNKSLGCALEVQNPVYQFASFGYREQSPRSMLQLGNQLISVHVRSSGKPIAKIKYHHFKKAYNNLFFWGKDKLLSEKWRSKSIIIKNIKDKFAKDQDTSSLLEALLKYSICDSFDDKKIYNEIVPQIHRMKTAEEDHLQTKISVEDKGIILIKATGSIMNLLDKLFRKYSRKI